VRKERLGDVPEAGGDEQADAKFEDTPARIRRKPKAA
jgi:hypothetical protein